MLGTASYIEPTVSFEVKTPAIGLVVSLDEQKAYSLVDFNDDDALLTSLIDAASLFVEKQTGYGIGSKVITVYPSCDGLGWLPLLPVTSPLDSKVGKNQFQTGGNASLEMTVGYSAATLPADLKLAIMKIVSTAYEQREDTAVENIYDAIQNSHMFIKALKRRIGI